MSRWVLALLGAVVAGSALWLLLLDRPGAGPQPEPTPTTAGSEEGTPAPRLHGVGEDTLPVAPANEGRFRATGTVLDGEGTPLSGMEIEVRSEGPWPGRGYHSLTRYYVHRVRDSVLRLMTPLSEGPPTRVLVSDERGRFVFRTDEPGRYGIRARVEAPRITTTTSIALFDAGFTQEPVIRVLEGAPLTGRVLDAFDRSVAARVEGRWSSEAHGDWTGRVATDAATGVFTFDAVPRGAIAFSVQTALGSFERLAVVSVPTEAEVLMRIPRGSAALEGRVHTAADVPVPGALVRIAIRLEGDAASEEATRGGPSFSVGVRADADGTVRVEGLPPGHVHGLSVVADGYRPTQLYQGRAWPGLALPADTTTPFDVTLSTGSTVHGCVRSRADEKPIPGAKVTLYFLGYHPPQEVVAATDQEGRYEFLGIGAGRFVLVPSRATYFNPQVAEALDPGRRVRPARQTPPALSLVLTEEDVVLERDLVLARGGRIAGRVVDPAGRPAPGAEIFVRGYNLANAAYALGMGVSHADVGAEAVSDAEGRFEVVGLPPREGWVLFARKSGFAGTYADPIPVVATESADGVVLRLVEGCVVRGHVYDESGEPVEGQSVFFGGRTELRGGVYQVNTDADGSFEADSLPAAHLTLTALRANGQRAELDVSNLKPGEVREGLVLSFGTGLEVSGTVVDQHGKPVASLPVFAQRRDGTYGERQARTDATGAFRVLEVRPGKIQLQAFRGGNWLDLGEIFEPPATNLRLVYERPDLVVLEGTVVGPDGDRVPQCRVEVRSSDGRSALAGRQGLVANGAFRFEFRGKPPFDLLVMRPVDRDGKPLNLRGGYARVSDPSQPVAVRLERAYEIRGRVVDEEGEPVAGAVIHAQGLQARSDLDGTWRLVGLAPGRVPLRVEPPGAFMPPSLLVADEGQQDVRIELGGGTVIAGRVLLPEGMTLPGGNVTARWPADKGHAQGNIRVGLSPTGTFRLTGIPPDVRVDVRVEFWRTEDGRSALAPALVEDVQPGTEDLRIPVDVGVGLSGRVLDARGAPLAEGSVSARGRVGTGWTRLDAEGRFRMEGLRPGAYRIFATDAEGFHSSPQEVTAPATDVRIAMPDMGTLDGRLLGAGEEGTWEVRVVDPRTGDSPPSAQPAKVSADGAWGLRGVPLGQTWIVTAGAEGGDDRYARSAPVTADRDDIELTLEEGQRIEGSTQRDGQTLPRCFVRATAPGWQSYASSDGEGRFVLRGLPPGRYRLQAESWEAGLRGHLVGVDVGTTGVVLRLERDGE